MQDKDPGDKNAVADESSTPKPSGDTMKQPADELQDKAEDQSQGDKQRGGWSQKIGDKQALGDQQVPAILPTFSAPVLGASWSTVDKSSDESGKQPAVSPDQTATFVDQPAPPVDDQVAMNQAPGTSAPAGPGPSVVDTPTAETGTDVHFPGGPRAGEIQDPGTIIAGTPGTFPEVTVFAPVPHLDDGRREPPVLSLMDPGYVLNPVALALSGGGAFGAFQVGALEFIYDQFMGSEAGVAAGFSRPGPDIVTGTSIGAVNGAWISQGNGSLGELKSLWFGLRQNDDMFVLNSAFKDLIGRSGDPYGPAIGKIVADFWWGVAGTLLVPFGFLSFGRVGDDLSDLYKVLNEQTSLYNLAPIEQVLADRERYWSPTGTGLRGAGVSVARDLRGHRIVFARGYDDMLYVRWQLDTNPISRATPWSAWISLGGPISSDPVAFCTGFLDGYGVAPIDNPVRVGVIARLANEQEYGSRTLEFDDITQVDRDQTAPFQEWVNVPSPGPERNFRSQPTIVNRAPDGRAWAFCHDGDHENHVGHSFFSQVEWDGYSWGWGTWTLFGQTASLDIAGNITGCSYSNGTLELFTHSASRILLRNFTADGGPPGDWSGGLPGPGNVPGEYGGATSDLLVVLVDAPGFAQVDIFWRGIDGQVWTRRKVGNAAWGLPRNLGLMITSNLCSGRNSSDICTIFARGLDDNLYELRQTSRFAEWPANAWNRVGAPPNLTLLADPYTLPATHTSDILTAEIEVYAVASDHSVWTIRQLADGYTPWVSLGGKVWTGIQLRMSTVALETNEDRFVDEAGRFAGTLERIVSGDMGNIDSSRTNGIIASASLPGLFPPVRLNGRTWVDGGVRRGVPIGAAIDAGAKRVIAISTAPTRLSPAGRMLPRTTSGLPADAAGVLIEDYSHAGIVDIAMRSLMRLVDSMHWAEIAPETKWPVPVTVIQPTFKIKSGDAIDPGLISINYAYGWMRAFDILMTTSPEERAAAIASTDRIISARSGAWVAEVTFREAYLVATSPYNGPRTHVLTAELDKLRRAGHLAEISLGQSRLCKAGLRDELVARRNAGFPLDPESPNWLARFEMFAPQESWGPARESLVRSFDSPFDEIEIDVARTHIDHTEYSVGAAPRPTLDG